jgi:hypothetical protein
MSGTVTLAVAAIDQVTGPIAIVMAGAIGITHGLRWTFGVVPAASAPAGGRVQRRKASAAVIRLAMNQTGLAHSTSLFMCTDYRGPNLSAASNPKPTMPAISAALHRR